MEKKDVLDLIGVLGQLILAHGVPGAIEVVQGIEKETITADDIRELKALVRPPEEYFKKG